MNLHVMVKIPPPASQQELMSRANSLAGRLIGDIAEQLEVAMPQDLKIKKGWQGQLIEAYLGADSGNLSRPDFNHLGIELKTLPINFSGQVLESTYICVLNLAETGMQTFEKSQVYQKLSHVLWVPIARDKTTPLHQYQVASPFFWRPSLEDMALLRSDWENAMTLISLGRVDQLNARLGQILQVRPKAAHSRVLTKAIGREGQWVETLPRGFYLRAKFTQLLLSRCLKLD